MQTTGYTPERLLRIDEVSRITSQSRSTIYQMISKGTFPRPVRLGSRSIRWPESQIREWIENLPRAEYRADHTA